jgi:hypothetical protein
MKPAVLATIFMDCGDFQAIPSTHQKVSRPPASRPFRTKFVQITIFPARNFQQ